MNYENLPIDDLIKIGIMKNENEFSDVLTEKQKGDFLKGGTMLVETNERKYIFNLKTSLDESMTLSQAVVSPQFEMSNQLDNSENLETLKTDVFNKQTKGYGEIQEIAQKPFLGNSENELKTYVKLKNDNGKEYEFWGEENLKNKIGEFQVGDTVQIDFKGIEKDSVNQDGNTYTKNENIFDINKLDDLKNGVAENTLFSYNSETNQIVSYIPKVNNLISINGHDLSDEDKEELQKGGVLSLPDGSQVQIDPTAENNPNRLTEKQKKLLMASMMLDGGMIAMTIIITRAIRQKHKKEKAIKLQQNSKLYKTALDKMLKYLSTKKTQYPNDDKIKSDINIVSRERSRIASTPDISTEKTNTANDNLANKGSVNNLRVNDYDLYEDLKREKEEGKKEAQNKEYNKDLNNNGIPDRLEKDRNQTGKIKR